jgi:predicted permease
MGQTLDVIWVAVRAILQVFMVVGVGAVLTRMGYLGRETLQSLGKV